MWGDCTDCLCELLYINICTYWFVCYFGIHLLVYFLFIHLFYVLFELFNIYILLDIYFIWLFCWFCCRADWFVIFRRYEGINKNLWCKNEMLTSYKPAPSLRPSSWALMALQKLKLKSKRWLHFCHEGLSALEQTQFYRLVLSIVHCYCFLCYCII